MMKSPRLHSTRQRSGVSRALLCVHNTGRNVCRFTKTVCSRKLLMLRLHGYVFRPVAVNATGFIIIVFGSYIASYTWNSNSVVYSTSDDL